MPNLDVLFKSYRLSALNLPNRVVMARMTRSMSLDRRAHRSADERI